jgi:ArsR family transcriptional regulator, arsenate/arsenite/antimonite-responsive transcriptional repressor
LQLMQLVAARGPICGCHLEDELPHSQPLISKHLNHLRRAGLVTARREGRWNYYSATPGALEQLGGTLLGLADTAHAPRAADHCD